MTWSQNTDTRYLVKEGNKINKSVMDNSADRSG